ncbi:MAG: hypothetical protein HOW73_45655 [Polyangiaceae bacterium]|nr:hypothetical protein [Polyangiaceae bacterium]
MRANHLRNRYLAAMGITTTVLSSSCHTEGGTTPEVTATATATADIAMTSTSDATATAATASVSAPPSVTVSSTAVASASVSSWAPTEPTSTVTRPTLPTGRPLPTCPAGKFCVAEVNAAGSAQAAPPFGKCAQSVQDPEGGPMGERKEIRFDAATTKHERGKIADACCYSWFIPCPGGRPLVVDGAVRTAPVARREDWSMPVGVQSFFASLPDDTRSELAEHYKVEASYEHASIASFARVSLSLLAQGAPADLVEETHRAALDEVKHARAMFALASAAAGAPIGPALLDTTGVASAVPTIEDIAREAFFEGCAGEAAAALVLREEATSAPSVALCEILSRMAEDEERHAELAWRTVAWALSKDTARVLPILSKAREEIVREVESGATGAPGHSTLHVAGVTSAQERAAVRRVALHQIVLPCLDALLSTV